MDSREYLEAIVAASYRAELEHEENVIRSLPFVAGALAVLATVLGFIRSYLPMFDDGWYTVFIYFVLTALGIAIFTVIFFLFLALRAKRYEYISSGADLRAYREDLIVFYRDSGLETDQIDGKVISDMRDTMTDQYIVGSIHNRRNNFLRAAARARAFTSLVFALALAFVLLGSISIHQAMSAPHSASSRTARENP